MSEINYDDYMGKVINYTDQYGYVGEAMVVACDPDVGVTIVKADDHKHYLMCLTCPKSPKWKELKLGQDTPEGLKRNREIFKVIHDGVKSGYLDVSACVEVWEKFSTGVLIVSTSKATAEACPLS